MVRQHTQNLESSLAGVPGFRRWRKDRKHLVRILLVMCLSFFLMEFTFLLGDSLETSLEERRKDAYGAWQFALLSLDPEQGESHSLENSPFIQQSGYIWSQAILTNPGLDADYGVGGIDSGAVGLARIQVLEGHLPEQPGEAALEASLANRLGLQGQLGETVRLHLAPVDERGRPMEGAETEEMEIRLCGIIRDYNANWCISNQALLPSVFLSEEAFAGWENTPYSCFLMLGDPDWDLEEMEQDLEGRTSLKIQDGDTQETILSRLSSLGQKLERNVYTYPSDPANNIETMMTAVRLLGGLLAAIILVVTVVSSVRSRREEWRSLTLLGAERGQLRGILAREALAFGLLSMALGLGLALAAFALLLPLSSRLVGFSLYYGFSGPHLLLAAALGGCMVLLSYLLPFLEMRRLSRLHQPPKKEKKPRRRRKGRSAGPVTFGTLWRRQWSSHPWICLAQLVILTGALILPGIGAGEIASLSRTLHAEMRWYGDSYTCMRESGDSGAAAGVPGESLEALRDLYGVESYTAYQNTLDRDPFFLDLSGLPKSEYRQMLEKDILQNLQMQVEECEFSLQEAKTVQDPAYIEACEGMLEAAQAERTEMEERLSQGQVPTTLLTIQTEKDLQIILENLDQGAINIPDFFAGNSAILVLPVQAEPSEAMKAFLSVETTLDESTALVWQKEGRLIWEEQNIPTGILLPVSYLPRSQEHQVSSVRVDGILWDMEMDSQTRMFARSSIGPYGLVCSEAFLEKFDWPSAGRYQYIQVNASPEAGYGTDVQVARTLSEATGMAYENHRTRTEQLRQDLYLGLALYGSLCGLGTLLLLTILAGVSRNSLQYQQGQWHTLKQLGMKGSWQTALPLFRTGVLALLAAGLSVLAISVLSYREYYWGRIEAETPPELIRPFFLNLGMDGKWYALLCLVVLAACMAVSNGSLKAERR